MVELTTLGLILSGIACAWAWSLCIWARYEVNKWKIAVGCSFAKTS